MNRSILLISIMLSGVFLIGFNSDQAFATPAEGKPAWETMSDKVCGDKLCSEMEPEKKQTRQGMSIAYFPPPLKQIREGVETNQVTCTEGKSLILKQSTGMPACVKPSSIEKLIERGWAIHVLPDYVSGNNNSEIFKTGKYSVTSEDVNYFDDAMGYISRPLAEGTFPAVVMIHEWWGLNDNIKEMADKLSSHGYVVLAVDLYNGQVGATTDEARQLVSSFNPEDGVVNMNAAILYLEENYSPNSVGSIGWCFGGGQSLNLAMNNDSMDATVIYYGSVTSDTEQLSSINWPVLGIFAELDRGITVDSVNGFEDSLNELEIENQIYIYEGVDHAFANPSGERYAPEESQDAWQKTLHFFRDNLN